MAGVIALFVDSFASATLYTPAFFRAFPSPAATRHVVLVQGLEGGEVAPTCRGHEIVGGEQPPTPEPECLKDRIPPNFNRSVVRIVSATSFHSRLSPTYLCQHHSVHNVFHPAAIIHLAGLSRYRMCLGLMSFRPCSSQ